VRWITGTASTWTAITRAAARLRHFINVLGPAVMGGKLPKQRERGEEQAPTARVAL
jgi:hypothetical protein